MRNLRRFLKCLVILRNFFRESILKIIIEYLENGNVRLKFIVKKKKKKKKFFLFIF